MKNLVLIIGVIYSTIILLGCGNRKKVLSHINKNTKPRISTNTLNSGYMTKSRDYSKVLPDSTQEPGYDPAQRAFYWYLMSLPEEKRQEWVKGTYSEQEKDNFLNKIDSLHMDIQLPDPPNSTIPDSQKK